MITTRSPRERAYLIGVLLPGSTEELVHEQMVELADLARTAGADVVGSDVQRRGQVDARHFIGMGKVEELRGMKLEGEFDVIMCNEDLSPRQQRNLELDLKTRVLDRTEVILEIFAQHTRTHAACKSKQLGFITCCHASSARTPMTARSVGGVVAWGPAAVSASSRSR